MIPRVLNLLPLAFLALPLRAQTRVDVSTAHESEPIVQALRSAVLASASFVMDRDTTHVRFWIHVQPGGSMRCGQYSIKSVALVIERTGPHLKRGNPYIVVNAYTEGNEVELARRMLAQIEEATRVL